MDKYEPNELFVYTRDGDCQHMELGMVKGPNNTGDGYFCWYSRGDMAANTPTRCMRKLANAGCTRVEALLEKAERIRKAVEQAMRVKLTAEQVREVIERHSIESLGCRRQFRERDWQAIADELNATLGGGECVPHGEWESISQNQEVRHVFCECGHELGMDRRDSLPFERTQLFAMPNYCQECGRKIRIRKAVEQ